MSLLQGSSYCLPIQIVDNNGNIVTGEMVEKATFTFGDITKDGVFNSDNGMWEVKLSEEETFGFKGASVKWQARFLFVDGSISGTIPQSEYIYSSINQVRLDNEEEEEIINE